MLRQRVLDQLVAESIEKYQRAATELGIAKESQVREPASYLKQVLWPTRKES